MKAQPVPFVRTLFVCTNRREEEGGRPSCALRGAESICQALKDEIQKRGLKGKIRAMKSGCHDQCEEGPNIMIFPDGVMETHVTIDDVPALAEKYLLPL